MNNFFISLLFLIQILTVLNFDCSGIDENGCKDFTYSGSFINNISEKIDTLNNFYNKISNNSDEKKNFSFKFDEKTGIYIQTHEYIQQGSSMFTYSLNQIVAQNRPDFMDFSQFIDELSRFRTHTIGMSVKIGHSKFLRMKEKAILLLWLHIAQRNDSLIGEYISTFSEDVFSPYLQFGDDEVDILKNINEDYALLLNSKRNQIKTNFDEFFREMYTHMMREMLTALLRYPSTDVLLKIDDYIFVEFFLEKISFTIDSEIYIFPFLDLIREDYSSNIRYNNQENVVINHEKHCLTYKSDFDIKNDSILSKFHRKSLENLFVIDGIFDRNHPLECEKIQLWEVFNEGFKMTRGHANLYYYIPFPNFGICYRNSSEDNVRITLLVRSLNMNDDEAQDCYMKAMELDKIKGLKGMEILIELEKTCTKPELKLNSKDVATNEIDAKIKKFEIILEKIQKLERKKEGKKLALKNIALLKDYALFKYEIFQSAMDHLNSLPFIITEEDLKRKKMNQEKLEELKSKISIDIEVNRENQDDNSSENEEEDEDFKLEEKIEL